MMQINYPNLSKIIDKCKFGNEHSRLQHLNQRRNHKEMYDLFRISGEIMQGKACEMKLKYYSEVNLCPYIKLF